MAALAVFINNVRIGVIEHFDDESETFTFDSAYLESDLLDRPILGQLFEDRFPNPIHVGGPLAWFANLLPQGAMRQWRSRLYGIDEDDSFQLLSHLGLDLPGAVVLIQADNLSIGSIRRHQHHRLAQTNPDEKFRFSLAGNQWKLSARSTGRGLTTNASAQGVEYIAKFHSPLYPGLPQCEFATMNWACKSGIQTPEFDLRSVEDIDSIPDELPQGDGKVFTCMRFDRTVERRVHMEDFAQILDRPPSHLYQGKYEEIARVIGWVAPQSVSEYIRLVVFCLVSGNGDAHLKNFSILYHDGRNAVLSPAYDLVSTLVYFPAEKESLALSLFGAADFASVERGHLIALSQECGLNETEGRALIEDTVQKCYEAWLMPSVSEEYTKPQSQRITAHLNRMKARIMN